MIERVGTPPKETSNCMRFILPVLEGGDSLPTSCAAVAHLLRTPRSCSLSIDVYRPDELL